MPTGQLNELADQTSVPMTNAGVRTRVADDDQVDPADAPLALTQPIATPTKRSSLEDASHAVSVSARSARDAFRDACESNDETEAEQSFQECWQLLESIWQWDDCEVRGQAFIDLLGLLDAALRNRDFRDFNPEQRDTIRQAIIDLPKSFVDAKQVSKHLRAFVDANIDVISPVVMDADEEFFVEIRKATK